MNVIKKIAIVAIPFLLLLFFPKGACATERYQQQNYWYKADSNQNADVALNNPRKVNAAYVDDGNVSIGRLITAGNAISRRSEIKNYLVGKDIYEKEWYFCGEDTNAKWVHPVDYNTESIEYPDTLFCEEKWFTVIHIGGTGKSYMEGDYADSSTDYELRISADNHSRHFMEDISTFQIMGSNFFYSFDYEKVDIHTGSFGNGYVGSTAIAYESWSGLADSETIEVNTRYVNNKLKSVIIPETVIEIAPYTFYLCNALSDIYGCKGVEMYGEYCFAKEYTAEISSFGIKTYIHRYQDEYTTAGDNAEALIIAANEFEPEYINNINFPDCDFAIGEYAFMGACLFGEIELLNCVELAEGALKDNVDITVLKLKKLKEVNAKSIEGCSALRIEYVKDEVLYEVRHYLQELGGEYFLYESQQFLGRADSVCTPEVYQLDGFLTPRKRSIKINASGTSCVSYYYDRKSASLETFGNEGIVSVSGTGIYLYGTKVNIAGTVREGWRFAGWKLSQGGATTYFEAEDGMAEILVEVHDTDISVELVAEPIDTTLYQVRYYFMDEAGKYVLGYSEKRYGTTGAQADVKENFEGFILTEKSKATIKGNGSTIVEVYFKKADSFVDEREECSETEQTEANKDIKELYECQNGHLWYRGSGLVCPFCTDYTVYEDYEIIEYKKDIMERLYEDECNS